MICGFICLFWLVNSEEFFKKDVLGVLVGSVLVGVEGVGWCEVIFEGVVSGLCCVDSGVCFVRSLIFVFRIVVVLLWFLVIFLNCLGKKLIVFVFSVFNVVLVFWCVREENMIMGIGYLFIICCIVEILFMIGIFMFMVIMLGCSFLINLIVLCLFFVLLIIFSEWFLFRIFLIWWW